MACRASCAAVDYSFGDSEDGPFRAFRWSLVHHILGNVNLRRCFVRHHHVGGDATNIVWNKEEVAKWMRAADQLGMDLGDLSHVSCGSPAQMKEYRSFLMRNTSCNNERCLYWHREQRTVIMVQRYVKTYNVDGGKPLVHIVRSWPRKHVVTLMH